MAGLKVEMRLALIVADRIWRKHGKELVITSGLDSEHSAGSWHYYGYALDLRSRYFTKPGEADMVAKELQDELGSAYDVVHHALHIHVEYDPG